MNWRGGVTRAGYAPSLAPVAVPYAEICPTTGLASRANSA